MRISRSSKDISKRNCLINRYGEFLPVDENTPIVSLDEGNTPLLRAEKLAEAISFAGQLFLKFEGMNPTGSFKDRGMTVAISKAVQEGASAVICASTGNTSASAAAYAAKAGLRCIILVPQGAIALGKLAQAAIAGANIVAIKGNFDQALTLVRQLVQHYPLKLVNSLNPYRIEGQKTAAFEICEQLHGAPDYLSIPVGNAGNITAYWKGFREFFSAGRITALPQMLGFQAEGAAPIVCNKVVENPETIASAIRIGNPASWEGAIKARDESNGRIETVTDSEIIEAYQLLSRCEGVFSEPASAASVAGVQKLSREGYFKRNSVAVCVLTGSGLKDPQVAINLSPQPHPIAADFDEIVEKLHLN